MHQKALLGIANLLPADIDALLRIPHFGKAGAAKYGEAILSIVREFVNGD